MKNYSLSSVKKLPLAMLGAISITLGIVSKVDAVSFYSITNLGSSNYDSFNYQDELAVGGKAYTATAYVRGDEYIYYNDGTKEYLGSLDTSPGFYPTSSIAINNNNQVIGSSGYASAFIWSKDIGIQPVRGVNRYPYYPSGYVGVSDINNLGQVVGWAGSPSSGTGGFINTNGSLVSIGVIPGYDLGLGGTSALGINDKGQVVGSQGSSSNMLRLAILYEEGKLYDLNNLIQDNSGWILETALDISNQGEILGRGLFNGQPQTFLATPSAKDVAEPSQSFSILAFGSITAGYMVKRRIKKAS